MHNYRFNLDKSPLRISGTGHIYRAPRAVSFAIAQLSC